MKETKLSKKDVEILAAHGMTPADLTRSIDEMIKMKLPEITKIIRTTFQASPSKSTAKQLKKDLNKAMGKAKA